MTSRTMPVNGAHLNHEAALPPAPALELAARLTARKPLWDVELTETGLGFAIPFDLSTVDRDLGFLEECCQNLERGRRVDGEVELRVWRGPAQDPGGPPKAAGPWEIAVRADDGEPAVYRPDRLFLPAGFSAGPRLWQGESLLLEALAAHLTPPPGAPETKGRPALALTGALPLAPLAAKKAGAAEVTVVAEKGAEERLRALAAANGLAEGLTVATDSFNSLKNKDWREHFGLITVHLSPYLAARRLATLAAWLAPGGRLLAAGAAPGPQIAWLLRAAAKAGLALAGSSTAGPWAALNLMPAPRRPVLPPIVCEGPPALAEAPPEPAGGATLHEEPLPEEPEEIPEDAQAMVDLGDDIGDGLDESQDDDADDRDETRLCDSTGPL